MRKVPKHKMIAKSCPKCSMQLPIASKTCACGHIFVGRRSNAAQESDGTSITRRRTERVKREKPNYYDALEYDKETRKQQQRKRSMRATADQSQNKNDDQIGADDDVVHLKRKRKRNFRTEQDSDDRDNCFQIISPENGFKCSVILSEINRKMGVTSWRV